MECNCPIFLSESRITRRTRKGFLDHYMTLINYKEAQSNRMCYKQAQSNRMCYKQATFSIRNGITLLKINLTIGKKLSIIINIRRVTRLISRCSFLIKTSHTHQIQNSTHKMRIIRRENDWCNYW